MSGPGRNLAEYVQRQNEECYKDAIAEYGQPDYKMPLAIVSPTHDSIGREYLWGTADASNPLHSDMACLREMVVEAYGCTEDCAQCFAARADCMKTFCFGGCIHTSTADEEDCDQCQADNYCLNPFQTCTGLEVF